MSRAEAHAKLNLRHRVFPRDASGYHGVETLMVRTNLTDTVEIEEAGAGVTVSVEGPLAAGVPTGPDNLCWRAADAFFRLVSRRGGARPGVHIRLIKRIPMGSGLGGGSADAAATLRLLAERWSAPSARAMVEIAGELGSDVPFGLIDVPMALGWERGRRLLPLRPPRPRPALLVCPAVHVSTPDAYAWFEASGAHPAGAAVLPGAARLARWESLERIVRNDLEAPVAARHPEVATTLKRLRATDPAVTAMTGSGSAVFAIFRRVEERDAARVALETAEGHGDGLFRLIDIRVPI